MNRFRTMSRDFSEWNELYKPRWTKQFFFIYFLTWKENQNSFRLFELKTDERFCYSNKEVFSVTPSKSKVNEKLIDRVVIRCFFSSFLLSSVIVNRFSGDSNYRNVGQNEPERSSQGKCSKSIAIYDRDMFDRDQSDFLSFVRLL